MLLNSERATEYLNKYDVKAIVATSPTNVAYLTGYDCWLYRKYLENVLVIGAPRRPKETLGVFVPGEDPVLITDTFTCLFAEELKGVRTQLYNGYGTPIPRIHSKRGKDSHHMRFFQDALKHQKGSPAEALVSALKDADITSGRVGIEITDLRPETRRAVSKALPNVELLDASETLSLIRMVKSDEELRRLKTASRINEDGLYKSLDEAEQGKSIGELSSAYLTEISRRGAIFDHYFYSPDGLYLSAAPSYRLRKGEYTMIDSGCTYELYYGDMATSILVGREDREITQTYEIVWSVIETVADGIGPGTRPSEIMARFEKAYKKTSIRNPDYQGHGIGLETREYPIMGAGGVRRIKDGIVDESTDIPLEEGMVISLETSLFQFGEGSYEVERTFHVGSRKLSEITSKRDRSMLVV